MSKKKTSAEIMAEDTAEMEAEERALLDDAVPKTPLEAAIDRATGFKPEDAVKAVTETEKPETETEKPETKTEKPETKTEKPETKTEKPETKTETKKRDYVEEAYKCFIKDAGDIDPTDPVKAVAAYFNKNATDELKARCKAEGKDAKGCWRFIEAVARKALGGRSGHIDPGVVYAIAMHWFEDVPVNWDKKDEPKKAAAPKKTASVQQQAAKPKAKPKKAAAPKKTASVQQQAAKSKTKPKKAAAPKKTASVQQQAAKSKTKPKKAAETPSEIRKEKERMAKVKAKAKAKKPRAQQGFFFEMLEMQPDGPNKDGPSSPQASAGASGEENAMVPSTLPASTSSESEVQG